MSRRFVTAVLASTFPLTAIAAAAAGLDDLTQLLPAGEFVARDGRPGNALTWKVSDTQGRRLAANISALAAKTPIVIDYEHQTLVAQQKGIRAPAAGWITSATWRDGIGLFAKVDWTAAAKGHIAADEYRYISPVITHDEMTGEVTALLMAGLVNYPALLGMEPVMAQLAGQFTPTHPSEPHMDLAKLLALLGLAATATEADVTAKITALSARPAIPGGLVTALGLTATADEATALSAITALKAASATDPATLTAMQALQTQVAALQGQINDRQVTELVDGAIAAKKLVPAQKDWAMGLGRSNLTALKGYIDSAVPIAGLGGQSDGKDLDKGGDATALSGLTADVIAKLGITAEQYQAAGKKA
jgi:phage I-like protein